jgi:hypothetical protein
MSSNIKNSSNINNSNNINNSSNINEYNQDGGAITKDRGLQNYSYKTNITGTEITINPSDMKFLASNIDERYLTTEETDINILALKFYKLFYKTLYHLLLLGAESNISKDKKNIKPIQILNDLTKNIVLDETIDDKIEKRKQQVKNSQFIKSSKYEDNTISKTNTPAKFLTQHCNYSYNKLSKESKKNLIRSSKFFGRSGFFSKFSRRQLKFSVKDNINDIFISDGMIQKIPENVSNNNNLKCILYNIRYNQIAFNYYLEKLINLYYMLLTKQEIKQDISNLVREISRKKIDSIISEFNNNDYKDITTLISNSEFRNGNLENHLIRNKANNTYNDILKFINGDNNIFNNYGANIKGDKSIYKYIFILITYYSKKFISPKFFEKKTPNSLKNINFLNGLSSNRIKLLRTFMLIASIPKCISILFGYIKIYKSVILSLTNNTGITHISDISANVYTIEKIFSKLKSEKAIKKKLENTKYEGIINKLLLASFVVDKLLLKTFGYLLFNNSVIYDNALSNLYQRLLATSFNNNKVNYDTSKINDIKYMEAQIIALFNNEILGVENITQNIASLYMADNFDNDILRNNNINECFAKLYDNVISVLLINPIIIHKRSWKQFSTGPSGEANQDIGDISKNIIQTLTNLIISIELGVYDFENNITFLSNYESVYSSLPLYYENIIKSKINAENNSYLLSNNLYKPIDKVDNLFPQLDVNDRNANMTSIEASLLSLEEVINIRYANNVLVFKPNQDVLVKRGEISRKLKYYTKQTGGEPLKTKLATKVGEVIAAPLVYTAIPVLLALSIGIVVTGAPLAVIPGLFKGQAKTYKGFASIIPGTWNLFNRFNIAIRKEIDGEIKVLSKLLTNKNKLNFAQFKDKYDYANETIGDNEIAKLLLSNEDLSLLYDLAFINNTESNNAADGVPNAETRKVARKLLIYIMTNKVLFMINRLKQLYNSTPQYDEYKNKTYNIEAFKKLYKITLSKAMIMLKLKQYLTDLMKIMGDIDKSRDVGNNVYSIKNKYGGNLEVLAANYIINNIKFDNNTLIAQDSFINEINDDIVFKKLFGLLSNRTKEIMKLDITQLSEKQKLDEKIKEAILLKSKLESSIQIDIGKEYLREGANNIKIIDIQTSINHVIRQGANNAIRKAFEHFCVDNANAFKAFDNTTGQFSNNSHGNFNWYNSIIHNNIYIYNYFYISNNNRYEIANNVFIDDETKDIDPVLLYKITMFILQKYNEAMKKCIDNYLKVERNTNIFKEKDIYANFNIILQTNLSILNNIIRAPIQQINYQELQKDTCEKLSKYYLLDSVIKNTEYIFKKLNEANDKFIKIKYKNLEIVKKIHKVVIELDGLLANQLATAAATAVAAGVPAAVAANMGNITIAEMTYVFKILEFIYLEILRVFQVDNDFDPVLLVKYIINICLNIKEYITKLYLNVMVINDSINAGVAGLTPATSDDIDELGKSSAGYATIAAPAAGTALATAAVNRQYTQTQNTPIIIINTLDTNNPINFSNIYNAVTYFGMSLGVLYGSIRAATAVAAGQNIVNINGINYTPSAAADNVTFTNEYNRTYNILNDYIDKIFIGIGDYVKSLLPAAKTVNIETIAIPAGGGVMNKIYPLDAIFGNILPDGAPNRNNFKNYKEANKINIIEAIENAVLTNNIYNMNNPKPQVNPDANVTYGLNLQDLLKYTKYIYPNIKENGERGIVFYDKSFDDSTRTVLDISQIVEPDNSYNDYKLSIIGYLNNILSMDETRLPDIDRFNIIYMINSIFYDDDSSMLSALKYGSNNIESGIDYKLSDQARNQIDITNEQNTNTLPKLEDVESVVLVDLFNEDIQAGGGRLTKTKKNRKYKTNSTKQNKMVKGSKTKKASKKYNKTVKSN